MVPKSVGSRGLVAQLTVAAAASEELDDVAEDTGVEAVALDVELGVAGVDAGAEVGVEACGVDDGVDDGGSVFTGLDGAADEGN